MAENEKEVETEFDVSDLDAIDESHMTVVSNGKPTSWIWTFAGPGHPKAVEQSNRLARERLAIERQQEQARVNGKKWRAPDERPDEALERNVRIVLDRLLRWSPVKFNGTCYEYSTENARMLLKDPRKGALLLQALEFLGDENAFTKRSANSSGDTLNAPSP